MFPAEMLDRLVAEELEAHFPCATIGRRIIVLEQTTSTNDAILQVPTANSDAGLVLFAEHQTSGRGQRGNRWESAAGKGLWFSVLLRPRIELNKSSRLTTWATEAIAGAIRSEFPLEPTIKLPNDVQVHGRKIAGVLVEMRAQEKAGHLAIVGIGINVNHAIEDFSIELRDRAISLAIALDRQIDRQRFAVTVLRDLNRLYTEMFGVSI